MAACVRPDDTVGRYGGEEFLIVVPNSDSVGTMKLAERIRQAIESSPIVTPAGEIQMTASLGVGVNDAPIPAEPQTLLHMVDEALYRAKRAGRNRSEFAAPLELAGVDSQAVTANPVASESK
jgi:two-component system, cell cycle response regulator